MLLTLEAVEAQFGDCLILHYGDSDDPKFLVIDGGPKDVYEQRLKPRLLQIRTRWHPHEALPIQMLMVSHIDNDHIIGVLRWMQELLGENQEGQPPSAEISTLWHNSFDDIIGNDPNHLVAALADQVAELPPGAALPEGLDSFSGLVLAQVKGGRELRKIAKRLHLLINAGFNNRLVRLPKEGKKTLNWGNGLQLTVLNPNEDRLKALQDEWDEKLPKLLPAQLQAEVAAYADRSAANLSSIVVLAETDGKRMLLTGDGRGDHIIEGLEKAGLKQKEQPLHVDLLKLPHHGSDRNVTLKFFQQVTADHYVVSANGKDGNPDVKTLQWLSQARGNAEFTLWLTNRDGKNNLGQRLQNFFASEKTAGKKYKPHFREDNALSLKVDLLEKVNY
jgi:hypothetical protein